MSCISNEEASAGLAAAGLLLDKEEGEEVEAGGGEATLGGVDCLCLED